MRQPRVRPAPDPSPADSDAFVARIRALEQEAFGPQLDPKDATRMLSDGYSWHYRPSHHAASGLVTAADVAACATPGTRLLSVGAHPAYLERLLPTLGMLPENIVIADSDQAFAAAEGPLERASFDMIDAWPEMGSFDLILFPESLCIALSDRLKLAGPQGSVPFATDALEAELLAAVLAQALARLRPGGEIRANGPQSHPNVVTAARAVLDAQGIAHELAYRRYFLRVRAGA